MTGDKPIISKPLVDPWLRLLEYTLLLRYQPPTAEKRAQILERILAIEQEAAMTRDKRRAITTSKRAPLKSAKPAPRSDTQQMLAKIDANRAAREKRRRTAR